MRSLVSNLLRKLAEEISAGIGKDEYLEHAEKEKKDSEGTSVGLSKENDLKSVKPSKDKEKAYQATPKIKPPRRQPSFKNKWDDQNTRKEYQRDYRLENGNK